MTGRAASRSLIDAGVAVALAIVLGGVYLIDTTRSPAIPPPPPATVDEVASAPPPPPPPLPPPPPSLSTRPVDLTPRVVVETTPDGRFGLSCLTGNPEDPSDDGKRLTFNTFGKTNNTRVMVDGRAPAFGDPEGQTLEPWHNGPGNSRVMTWAFRGVVVRLSLRLIPGDLSRRLDTLRVEYELKNTGSVTRAVGLRVMLDTLIGDNDGVPFIVPGREGIVTSPLILRGVEVPDFVRSLERPILSSPGVIVDLSLTPSEGERRPTELWLSHWPGTDAEWDYDRQAPFEKDTAAGLYYAPRPIQPGGTLAVGFSYGLGTISSTTTRNTRLSLTAGGPIRAGSSFWLVALVTNPRRGQSVNLLLPAGLTARRPASLSQSVRGVGEYTQLSWLVEVAPGFLGEAQVQATLDPGQVVERQTFNVQPPDARLSLISRGPFRAGRPFWISALVRGPRAGQSVALTLPEGLAFAGGHGNTKAVEPPTSGDYAQLNWLVLPGPRAEGRREISARLTPEDVESRFAVKIELGHLTD